MFSNNSNKCDPSLIIFGSAGENPLSGEIKHVPRLHHMRSRNATPVSFI